ncbi:MAG: 50S ribosomal protein L25/general stress protein Ctc [Burkholderiales bacterium]|jgi:large subunit ribosomal protein L25|nr:50S ribosomal protein L25/general stress protein Ctc [Burkholderiales bacterium]
MQFEVIATERSAQGTGASRRLRRKGGVPGIVYGGGKPPTPIELDRNALAKHLKLEAFHASVLTLKVGTDSDRVLLRDVQMHPWRALEITHIDFQRIAADQKLHMKVPLHFVNAENAPGVKLGHGIINHVLNEIDVQCLPADLPEFVTVDLGEVQLGDSIHLGDLVLPAGVESTQLKHGDNAVVATIQVPRGAVEAEDAAAPVSAANVPAIAQKEKDPAAAKASAKPAAKK